MQIDDDLLIFDNLITCRSYRRILSLFLLNMNKYSDQLREGCKRVEHGRLLPFTVVCHGLVRCFVITYSGL